MKSPLRFAVSVVVVVAIIALRVWIRSGKSRENDLPHAGSAPVEQAQVVAEPEARRAFVPFPPGDLREQECHFAFGVYHDPRPLKPPAEVVAALIPKFPELHFSEKPAETEQWPVFTLEEYDAKSFTPPDEESLAYCGQGLTSAEGARLQKCERASVFFFMGDANEASKVVEQGHEFLKAFAAETGGFLWDEETRQCFTAAAWDDRGRAGWETDLPVVTRHITIHFYANDVLFRAISLGMWKFGLPDVCLEGLTASEMSQASGLINLTCQTMIERGKLEHAGVLPLDMGGLKCRAVREGIKMEGGTGKAFLEVAVGARDEGDPDNRLLELRFLQLSGGTESERRHVFFARFFGSHDEVAHVSHDAELLAARDRARAKLLGPVKADYLKGLGPAEKLLVKAPFRTSSGGNEWMWVEVTEWKGIEIKGILMNDPDQCPGLKSGAHVVAKEDSLFDYIRTFPDGHDEGNETGTIMERREGESGER